MNIIQWITKFIEVPESNKTKVVESIQLWEVRWTSRYGIHFSDTQPEMEAFPTRQQAEEFATSLRNAFRLIRHTSGDNVYVKKASGGVTVGTHIKAVK